MELGWGIFERNTGEFSAGIDRATCVSVACFRSQGIGPPNGLSGLTTGFSFFRFTSQPFLGSLLWIRVVDDSFPGGVRSRTTRDHFQVYG